MRPSFVLSCLPLLLGVAEAFTALANSRAHRYCHRRPRALFLGPDGNNDDGMIIETEEETSRRNLIINTLAGGLLVASGVASWQLFNMEVYTPPGFQRIGTTQFLAALGDPTASEGTGAERWGLWRQDPGPRGVWLRDYDDLVKNNGIAPRGWKFDQNDFWIEEHGLIMESPNFPLKPGRYLVTGARSVTTGLTVEPNGHWKLDKGTLYDVTHLPCRSARYNLVEQGGGSPAAARLSDFPVKPGAVMPSIPGTNKQDYAVLFVIGKAV